MQEREIIERIQSLCEARSWTVYRLAKASGITYSTLCTMLHKSTAPSIPTLVKLCDGFGITLAQFFDTSNERALLSHTEKEHLETWNVLTDENRRTVEKFMHFLVTQQAMEDASGKKCETGSAAMNGD